MSVLSPGHVQLSGSMTGFAKSGSAYWFCSDAGVADWECMPWPSKTKVLASPSAPWAGTSWPFQRKVTPAALPTRATISRVAWTVVFAGAISVSCVTSWPSEVTEIHEVSVARMTRLRETTGLTNGAAGCGPKDRIVTSLFSTTFSSTLLAGVAAGAPIVERDVEDGFGAVE